MVREASQFAAMRRGAIMAELVGNSVWRRCPKATALQHRQRERIRKCASNNPLLLWKSLWASLRGPSRERMFSCSALDCPSFEQ